MVLPHATPQSPRHQFLPAARTCARRSTRSGADLPCSRRRLEGGRGRCSILPVWKCCQFQCCQLPISPSVSLFHVTRHCSTNARVESSGRGMSSPWTASCNTNSYCPPTPLPCGATPAPLRGTRPMFCTLFLDRGLPALELHLRVWFHYLLSPSIALQRLIRCSASLKHDVFKLQRGLVD